MRVLLNNTKIMEVRFNMRTDDFGKVNELKV